MRADDYKITIYHCQPSRLLPEDARGDVVNTIGSKWARGKKTLLMGITEEERLYLLPSIINVVPSSEHWEKAVNNFFANLAINVPDVEGLELNIATKPRTVTVLGETKEVAYPVAPMDYIMYKQCLADGSVAMNKEETKAGIFDFYIENKKEEEMKELEVARNEDKITSMYLDLIRYDENSHTYENMETMRHVLFVLGRNPDVFDDDGKRKALKDLKDQAIAEIRNGVGLYATQFVKTLQDPQLKVKGFIQALVQAEILKYEGAFIVDRLNPSFQLGASLDQAALWVDAPENSQKVQEYLMKFKSKKAIV